jgi:dolichyl-phosphate-mannose--protein O-mannosyl transferase
LLCAEKTYKLKDIFDLQKYMFDYHSKLTATHPFQSPWYTWPLVIKPIYYFAGSNLPEGTMQAIAAFGNPAVWWAGFIALFIVIYRMATGKVEKEMKSKYAFLLICLGAAYLPWVLITRATFIYHYFASVPFIILLTASLITRSEKRGLTIWAWVLIGLSLGLFVLFYPVWSGLPISRAFALKYMHWMPTWWFFS